MNETLDTSGQPRKVIAAEWFGRDEHTLSKMAGGGLAFGVDRLDQMPLHARVDWLGRYARRLGFRLEPIDTDQEMRDLLRKAMRDIESLVALHAFKDVQPRQAKADLPLPQQERRRA